MDRFFLKDFKPLYILDFYVMDRFVSLLTHWVWNATSFAKRPYNFKQKKNGKEPKEKTQSWEKLKRVYTENVHSKIFKFIVISSFRLI